MFKVVEGDLLRHHYKHLKVTIHVDPNKEGEEEKEGCVVKLTIDYEKWNDDVAPPEAYMDLAVKVIAATEAHLLNE